MSCVSIVRSSPTSRFVKSSLSPPNAAELATDIKPHHPLQTSSYKPSSSSASSSSSILPGIHEVFSQRQHHHHHQQQQQQHQRLPSFANFMPPAAAVTSSLRHGGSVTSCGGGLVGVGNGPVVVGGRPTAQLPPMTHGTALARSSSSTATTRCSTTPAASPSTRCSASPAAASSSTAAGGGGPATRDAAVQHSPGSVPGGGGFPSLDDVLSYYVSQGRLFRCQHCSIVFFERGMYFLHASLHGPSTPWQCSICHKLCSDKNEFTLHFVNQQHNPT